MPSKPYNKDFVELINWLRKKKYIMRMPKNGPPQFYYNPTYWEKFKEQE